MQFANCFEIGVGRVYEVFHSAYTHFFPVRRLSTSQPRTEFGFEPGGSKHEPKKFQVTWFVEKKNHGRQNNYILLP